MSDIVSIIRSVVQEELKKLNFGEVAKVVKTYAHAEGDSTNYECDIEIRETGVILEQVPMTTPHIGMASPPVVDELVLVIYIHGDINQPVIAGRLYSNEIYPPEYTEDSWKVAVPTDGERSITLDDEGKIVLTNGDTTVTIEESGKVEIISPEDIDITVDGNTNITCSDCTIDASGDINLGTGGGAVITDKSHKCYYSGAPLVGSTTVKAKD